MSGPPPGPAPEVEVVPGAGTGGGDGPGVPDAPAALLARRAETAASEVALRVKRLGLWEETTWGGLARRAARVGLGLRAAGFGAGDRIALVADGGADWLAADLGAQGAGFTTVIADPLGPLADEQRLLADSGAVAAVVQDEEQLDRIRAVQASLPALRLVAVADTRGIRRLGDDAVGLEELEERTPAADAPARWVSMARSLDPATVATVVPSLGTTGPPKAALLTHANLAAAGRAAAEALGLGPGDEILSALPLCFMTERVVSELAPLHCGAVVNFGESPAALLGELREVQPTVLLGVPHLWGRIEADVRARRASADPVKRAVLGYLERGGPARADRRVRGGRLGAGGAVAWFVGARALGRRTGTGRLRVALSTGAWLPPAVHGALRALGVPIRQLYGQVETSGIATVAAADDARPESVGVPVPGVEVELGSGGEILVSGSTLFAGYLGGAPGAPGAPGEPAGVDPAGGRWPTGDLGVALDDGAIAVTGRVRDLVTTSGGASVHPGRIEKLVEESPFVREAVVVGQDRPHLSVLLALDEPALVAWAAARDHPTAMMRELVDDPDVRALVEEWIDDVNGRLAPAEQIRAFALLADEWAGEYDELTAINEVRRRAVLDRYADLVEGLYRP
ncbi:MAG: AMP-binding protein [Acidimicrobiia bacterium]|nr:AMP-binding protein [Acidimicrobiia bacterium]